MEKILEDKKKTILEKIPRIYTCQRKNQRIKLRNGYVSEIAAIDIINVNRKVVSVIISRYNSGSSIRGEKSRLIIYYSKLYQKQHKIRDLDTISVVVKMEQDENTIEIR